MLSPTVRPPNLLHLLELLLCVALGLRIVQELFNQRTFTLFAREIPA